MYILVVDDDRFSNSLVEFVLSKEGYDVETTDDPRHTLQMIQRREPDLLILDIRMPFLDGFTLATEIRNAGYKTPFIFMTAMDSVENKLKGFRIGAGGYICKPFHHQKLAALVHAVTSRIEGNRKKDHLSLRGGGIELFPAQLKVEVANRGPIKLSPTEMQVLRVLMEKSGQVLTREHVLAEVWKDMANKSNIVDVYIRRLREKLEIDPKKPKYIISVRGSGYKFKWS